MKITFYGAVREVTGSMHLLSTDQDRILLDCGMFQGRRKEAFEKNRVMPLDPAGLTNVVLSHAHIDHSGRLPVLVKQGFNGHILCTRATADACNYLLLDAAHIQESDAAYLNYKTLRNHLNQLKKGTNGSPSGISHSHQPHVPAFNRGTEGFHGGEIGIVHNGADLTSESVEVQVGSCLSLAVSRKNETRGQEKSQPQNDV